jgi:glycerate dehydrogenase
MTIVVLDGYTLNPGDLDWGPLRALGTCAIYDRTEDAVILERSRDARILLTNKTPLTRSSIQRLPALEFIGVLATGYNVVDIDAATERRIPVANVPAYGTASVAQMAFAHILNLTALVGPHAQGVADGEWSAARDWSYWRHPLTELDGLTLGIIGYGRIGKATAHVARAFGMPVIVAEQQQVDQGEKVERVTIEEIFRRSDIVSLHCPLTEETRGLVNSSRLALMKPSALLINTSRGGLVDEAALAEALNSGRIAGAGLDVLSQEPPPASHPLLRARNCFITPHIAWATRAARTRLLEEVVENVRAFLGGRGRNIVNSPSGSVR